MEIKTNTRLQKILTALAIIGVALLLSFLAAPFVPPAIDWSITFRPAALTLLSGESPYGKVYVVHAPWALIMLAPLALLPEAVGRVMLWRQGGWKQVLTTFLPFTIVLLLSFAIFGLWPLDALRVTSDVWFNASLWPLSIPAGLTLFVTAIRKRKIEYAMAASPCLSPYVLFYSWGGVLLAIIASVPETIAAVIGLWILVAIRYFS